jgi:predicted ATP-grasp superfamily ATP-dependent carboligase
VRILITGLTTRAVAESAVRAGADIVTVDYFGDLDQERLCETHPLRERGRGYSAAALLDVARELPYDALVYCGGLENHPEVVADLADGRVLLGNEPRTLARVRDPATLFPYLARQGFAVPETRLPTDPLPGGGRWLLKPARGGGGQGVRTWTGQRPEATQILQEMVEGVSASASFVADGWRSVVLGWTAQLHRPRSFRYAGNVLPLVAGARARREVDAIAEAVTREYGLRGLNGFDFVLRDERPVVVEVNPRYCASMELVERAAGTSLFGLHLAACGGQLPAPLDLGTGVWGKAIVYASLTVATPDTTRWLTEGIRDVPHPGEVIRAGQPICTVLASAPTRARCEADLRAAAARVKAACHQPADRA